MSGERQPLQQSFSEHGEGEASIQEGRPDEGIAAMDSPELSESTIVLLDGSAEILSESSAPSTVSERLSTISFVEAPSRAYNEDELVGKTLAGRYQLKSVLGKGGMGAVFEASDLETAESVAVKLMLVERYLSKDVRRRFAREAETARLVQSEYAVSLLDSGSDEQLRTPFMVMELLQGADLSRTIRRLGPMDPRTVAKIGVQSCRGLQHIHEQGLIHRDIKPGNIFLSEQDAAVVVKVCDFGIAKQSFEDEKDDPTALTLTGAMLGTPSYSAPEQALNPRSVDARADVWSLCLTLYKALSGTRLWPRMETIAQLYLWICTQEIRPLQRVAPWVDPALATLIQRGLKRKPEDRWESMADLEKALLRWLGGDARLVGSDIKSLPQEQREEAATLLLQKPEEALTSSSLLGTAASLKEPVAEGVKPSSSRPRWSMGLAGLVLVGLGGSYALSLNRPAVEEGQGTKPRADKARVSPSKPSPTVATAPPSRQALLTAELRIEPASARVKVDGKERQLENGKLMLRGRPGEQRSVRVFAGGRSVTKDVIFLRDGSIRPAKVALPKRARQRTQAAAPKSLTPKKAAPKPKAGGWKLRADWKD